MGFRDIEDSYCGLSWFDAMWPERWVHSPSSLGIVTRMRDYRRGFGSNIGVNDHLYIQLGTIK
jgi:hypothetical protein